MQIKVGLFDIYIFLIALCKGIGLNSGSITYIAIFVTGSVLILVKMFHERYYPSELLSMLFITVVGLLDYLIGHTTTIFFTAVAICGLKNVDTNRAIKIVFWTRLICFAFMVIASSAGLIENTPLLFWRDGVVLNRYSFGYGHPNTAHMAFAVIFMMFLYLYGTKMNVFHFCILLAASYLLYQFTYSRTGFLVTVLCIAVFICAKIPKLQKLLVYAGRYLYWILFAVTLATGLLYGKVGVLNPINHWLTGRIYYNHMLLTTSFPPLIGRPLTEAIIIDNGYLFMLYEGGILVFLWISYYTGKVIKKAETAREYTKIALVVCFMIYAMTERFYPSISVNISLIFFGEVLFERRKDERSDYIYPNLQS